MAMLVIRTWNGLQHRQIVHDDLGATIKAEIKEGRAGGVCEAVGEMYGLPPAIRCTWDLRRGVNYDHDDPDINSKDASLGNCRCLCPFHHRHKTSHRDRPLIAKTNHQADMVRGIKATPHRPMPCGRNSKMKKKMNGEVVPR